MNGGNQLKVLFLISSIIIGIIGFGLRAPGAILPEDAADSLSAASAVNAISFGHDGLWFTDEERYLNRYARLMNAYERTSFQMASPQLAPLHSENVVMSRLQLAF